LRTKILQLRLFGNRNCKKEQIPEKKSYNNDKGCCMSNPVPPSLWPLSRVGDLCNSIELTLPEQKGPGSFRYVDISSIDNDRKVITEACEVKNFNAPSRARQIIATDDVLISTVRPNLNAVALVPSYLNGAICSTGFCVLRAKQDILEPKYLFAWVRFPRVVQSLVRLQRGAGYPAVSDSDVKNLHIPLPPLPEQKCIAAILEKADRLRRQRHYALELSNTYLQSVFLEMFKEAEHIFRIETIEDIASQERYALSSGPFGSNLTSVHYTQKGVLVLRGLNISDGRLNLDDVKYVNEEKAKELSRSEVHPGDIIVVAVGSSGFACQIPHTLPRAIMSQNFNKVTPDLSKIDPTFLEYLINSQFVQQQFHQEITDTVRTFLSLTKLKTVKIPLPPFPLQQKFAQIVQKFERLRAKRYSPTNW
jgi:type I restriction enzyme, S subunit